MSASRTGRSTAKPRSQPSQPAPIEQGSPPAGGAWPNVVIRASAGTGKTFQLSNRYLQLVGAGVRPESILAATFARKAAGEILARVMQRLAGAVLDEDACLLLAEQVGWTLDRAASGRLLGELLHNLHRLRIGTLDSFFVRLAGSFTLELGLPSDWRIVEAIDDGRWRLEAIRRVLAAGKTSEMLALVHLLFKGETTRSISEQISTLVTNLYDIHCETDEQAWHQLRRPARLRIEELAAAIESLAAVHAPCQRTSGQRFARRHRASPEQRLGRLYCQRHSRETGLRREGFRQKADRARPGGALSAATRSCRRRAGWPGRRSDRGDVPTAPRRLLNSISGSNTSGPGCCSATCRGCWPGRSTRGCGKTPRGGSTARSRICWSTNSRTLRSTSGGCCGRWRRPVASRRPGGAFFGRRREAGDLSLAGWRVANF